jgi:hypothetical protein
MEVGGQLHTPVTLPPGDEAPSTRCIGGWVGPRADLGIVENKKILHYQELNPDCPAHSLSLYWLSYPNSS